MARATDAAQSLNLPRLALGLVVAVLAVIAVRDLARLGDAAPWRQMYDFDVFYCAGNALDHHRNPYTYEPVHTCEHAVSTLKVLQGDPALAMPALQPPYAFPPFMALARLNFVQAKIVYGTAIVVALILSVFGLARTGVPFDVAAIALLLPAGYVELEAGQIVPFALLFLVLCGAALAHRRDALAGICAGMTAIEPHLALPVALALLLFVPRARLALATTLACLAGIGLLLTGPAVAADYVFHVVPLQAASEIGFPYQYSLAFLLNEFGVSDQVALTLGTASFVAFVVLGLWIAPRLARSLGRRELIAFLPAATAVMGGVYVHAVELCFAVPVATVLAVTLRGWKRNVSAAALCALVVPWIAVWSMKKLFALSVLLCVALLVRLQIDPAFAATTIATLAAIIYAFEMRPPTLPDAFRDTPPFAGSDFSEIEWKAFVQTLRPTDRHWLAIKLPTWAALIALLGTAVTQLKSPDAQASDDSISRRI
jgi:hypothetical protein